MFFFSPKPQDVLISIRIIGVSVQEKVGGNDVDKTGKGNRIHNSKKQKGRLLGCAQKGTKVCPKDGGDDVKGE